MRSFVLRVDVPEHGLAGPLRAHERGFATDEIEVAERQYAVIVGVIEQWQHTDAECATPCRVADGEWLAEPGTDAGQGSAREYQQQRGLGIVGERVEQAGDGSVFITEQ